MLHFDASDDYGPPVGPAASWAEVEPTPPHRAAGSRPRARPARPRRRSSRLRAGSRTALRHRRAAAAVAAALVIAAVVGASLVASGGSQGRPKPPASQAAPPHLVAPPASVQTTPTTAPVTAVLVATSAGSSTYRVGSSATISFRATSGTCWVEIRQSGPYGSVVFTGDITSGQSKELNGPVWVRLGNPGVIAVAVNGTSISPPGMVAGQPYDLQFA